MTRTSPPAFYSATAIRSCSGETALSPSDRVGDLGQQEEGDEAEHETGNDQQ